jgi:hypothetical protein
VSHGTIVIITFSPCGEHHAVAALALRHLSRVKDFFFSPDKYDEDSLFVAEQYLRAVAQRLIHVPDARYPNPPITFSTVNHRMDMDNLLDLLQPFFKDLFLEVDEDGESLLNHADTVCVFHQYENETDMNTWSITTNYEKHRGRLTGLKVEDVQFDIQRNNVRVQLTN